jgi:hypothetical protein
LTQRNKVPARHQLTRNAEALTGDLELKVDREKKVVFADENAGGHSRPSLDCSGTRTKLKLSM